RTDAAHEDEQHEEQPERAVATPASASPGLAPFQRLALTLTMIERLAALMPRMGHAPMSSTSASSTPSTAVSASAIAAPLSARQAELYHQLLGVFRHSLRHASTHVSRCSTAAAKAAMASDAAQLMRVHRERGQWVGMHVKLLSQCMDIVQPVLFGAEPA